MGYCDFGRGFDNMAGVFVILVGIFVILVGGCVFWHECW